MDPSVTYIYLHNRVPALTYRFTVEQFHRLADLGVLVWGDATELLDGQVVTQGIERRFTVEEFETMGNAGLFREDERVELLNGELILMSPVGFRHFRTVTLLNKFFVRHAADRYDVSVQDPIEVFGNTQPQPDLVLFQSEVLVRGRLPRPADIFLVVEVSDSTIALDQTAKLPMYAKAEIAEVWIVNLIEDTIEVHRTPRFDHYEERSVVRRGEIAQPTVFPDLQVSVDKIIP